MVIVMSLKPNHRSHWALVALFGGVLGWALLTSPSGAIELPELAGLKDEYRRPDTIPFPIDNPCTPEKAALGKMLFFDPGVSRAQNMNCASCHNPSFGWEVPLAKAIGAQNTPLARHAPTLINMAWSTRFFRDGRAASLEEQVRGPIEAPDEMDMPLDELVQRLKRIDDYVSRFGMVFPGQCITEETIVRALAIYERTIVSSYAPFDRWVEGDERAISAAAKRGFALFSGRARSASSHRDWNFSDDEFRDIGLQTDDPGRGSLEPGDIKSQMAIKTPSLCDLGRRGPFMHDGSMPSLQAVIARYRTGCVARPSRAEQIGLIELSGREVDDLLAFLETLSGDKQPVALPVLPH